MYILNTCRYNLYGEEGERAAAARGRNANDQSGERAERSGGQPRAVKLCTTEYQLLLLLLLLLHLAVHICTFVHVMRRGKNPAKTKKPNDQKLR